MDGDPRNETGTPPPSVDNHCPRCAAAELVGRHCKLICVNCGYVESCEDLFPLNRYRCIADADARAGDGRQL